MFLKCRDSPYVVHFKSRDYPYVESLHKKIRSNKNLTQEFLVQKYFASKKKSGKQKFGIPNDMGSLNILCP